MPVSRVPRIEDVGGVQERRALHADVDERRLHAGQDARDAAFVDVADQAAPAGTLEKHFLQHAVFDDGGARLVRAGVDEDLGAHRACPRPPARDACLAQQLGGFEQRQSHDAGIAAAADREMKIAARPWMA